MTLIGAAGCGGTAEPEATGDGVVFTEDFDGVGLDPARWISPEQPDVFRVRDGALHLVLGPEQTAEPVTSSLRPIITDPVGELTFAVGVRDVQASGPGGGSVTLTQADGRAHRVIFGPSGDDRIVGFLSCPAGANCANPDELAGPEEVVPLAPAVTTNVRVTDRGGRLEVYAMDKLIGSVEGAAPLTGFTVDVYGDEGEGWDIAVDSIRVLS